MGLGIAVKDLYWLLPIIFGGTGLVILSLGTAVDYLVRPSSQRAKRDEGGWIILTIVVGVGIFLGANAYGPGSR